jgi:hypothetical protein
MKAEKGKGSGRRKDGAMKSAYLQQGFEEQLKKQRREVPYARPRTGTTPQVMSAQVLSMKLDVPSLSDLGTPSIRVVTRLSIDF